MTRTMSNPCTEAEPGLRKIDNFQKPKRNSTGGNSAKSQIQYKSVLFVTGGVLAKELKEWEA